MKTGVPALLALLVLSACAPGGRQAVNPSGMTPQSAEIVRRIRMTNADRLVATRPALPPGTRIYRPVMALITSPDGVTFVPQSDVVSRSGSTIVVRINGVTRAVRNATVAYRDDVSETYVPPNVAVPKNLRTAALVKVVR